MISRVTLCGEPQAARGTCPEASKIGHTVVTAGPGPYPLVVPEPGQPPAPIYLTGGYEGAPYGLSIVVPLVTGPFNLGTIVVRGRDRSGSAYRAVDGHDRPVSAGGQGHPGRSAGHQRGDRQAGFMFNPTSCAPMAFSGTATSTEGTTAPIWKSFPGRVVSGVEVPAELQSLDLGEDIEGERGEPRREDRLPGGEPGVQPGQHPVEHPDGEGRTAQAAALAVDARCRKRARRRSLKRTPRTAPPASVVGHATAITPVLPVPLSGPAYFVSHGGEAFPSLIVVLQGYGVTVDLVGSTFISKPGITSSTFKQVPDVPIAEL